MSLINLRRDSRWTIFREGVNWSDEMRLEDRRYSINTDGLVYEDVASVYSSRIDVVNIGEGKFRCIGALMRPTLLDNGLYRIKASVDSQAEYSVVLGYGPKGATGDNDVIRQPTVIPFYRVFDDVVAVEGLAITDRRNTRPIAIGVAALGLVSGKRLKVAISIQRLATKPPRMNVAVS